MDCCAADGVTADAIAADGVATGAIPADGVTVDGSTSAVISIKHFLLRLLNLG